MASKSWRDLLALGAVRDATWRLLCIPCPKDKRLLLEQADCRNFAVCAVLLTFVNDDEEEVLDKTGPLHSEVLGNGPSRGHDELALAEHLPPFSQVDVEFHLSVATLIPFLITDQFAYAPKHPQQGVEP